MSVNKRFRHAISVACASLSMMVLMVSAFAEIPPSGDRLQKKPAEVPETTTTESATNDATPSDKKEETKETKKTNSLAQFPVDVSEMFGLTVHGVPKLSTKKKDNLDLSIDAGTHLNYKISSPLEGGQNWKGRIGNRVWNDKNRDGLQGSYTKGGRKNREPGVPNVVVNLYNASSNTAVQKTTTNKSGFYRFEDVPPGKYYILFELPKGYSRFTTLNQPAKRGKQIDSDANKEGVTTSFRINPKQTNYDWDAGIIEEE